MELKEYTRIPFVVNAVQVSLQNVEEIAKWCKGRIDHVATKMMGTETDLPCVKIPGQGNFKGQEFTAFLGYWVVERHGNFRVFKSNQFETTFEEYASPRTDITNAVTDFQIDDLVKEHASGDTGFVRDIDNKKGVLVEFMDAQCESVRTDWCGFTEIEKVTLNSLINPDAFKGQTGLLDPFAENDWVRVIQHDHARFGQTGFVDGVDGVLLVVRFGADETENFMAAELEPFNGKVISGE